MNLAGGSLWIVNDSDIKNGTFIIPSSVKRINRECFARLHHLTQITIPRNVEIIERNTFISCRNLISCKIENPNCIL